MDRKSLLRAARLLGETRPLNISRVTGPPTFFASSVTVSCISFHNAKSVESSGTLQGITVQAKVASNESRLSFSVFFMRLLYRMTVTLSAALVMPV